MIRVLHVLGGLNIGGAESRIMDIYRGIDREKIQFDFLVHEHAGDYFEDEIRKLGGRIYYLPQRRYLNLIRYKKSVNSFYKKNRNIDIVHIHSLSTSSFHFKMARRHGQSNLIAHSRSGVSNRKNPNTLIKEFLKRHGSKMAKYYFAVSDLAAIAAFGKKNLDKVDIIPNGINVQKYKFDQVKRENMRQILNLKENKVLLHIGRFEKQKNHLLLIKAFKEALKHDEKLKLILVGEGTLKKQIVLLIEKLEIQESVLLLGNRSDISDILSASDLLVFPSFFEGLPGVILEAQANGLKILMSDKITQTVILTDLIEVLTLKNPDNWARKILEPTHLKSFELRKSYNQVLIDKGYDIQSVCKYYTDMYIKITSE